MKRRPLRNLPLFMIPLFMFVFSNIEEIKVSMRAYVEHNQERQAMGELLDSAGWFHNDDEGGEPIDVAHLENCDLYIADPKCPVD